MSEETDMIDSTKENIDWIKPIKGHEDYLITNNGMIWSRKTKIWLKMTTNDEKSHLQAQLDNDYRSFVHRLVYQTFIGPIPKGYVVHHIDHNPINNLYTNLKAMTLAEHIRLHHEGKPSPMKGKTMSQQAKQKMSKDKKGKISPKKGKKFGPHSQEHKKKIGLKSKGRKQSEETKEKIRQARLGTKRSEETKKKLSEKGKEFYLLHPQRKNQNSKRMKQNPVQKDLLTGRFISINDQ